MVAKMSKILPIILFIVIVSASFVTAAASMSIPSDKDFGSLNRNQTITRSFSINNTGNVTLTGITPLTTASSAYNLKFNETNFTLAVGQIKTIGYNLTIPADSSTGNITIGTIYLHSDQYNSSSFTLSANIVGGLNIVDLDVTLHQYYEIAQYLTTANTKTLGDVKDGEKIDFNDDDYKIGPGSMLEFDFRIENLFNDDDDPTIEDVSVLVNIKEIDDGEDLDEQSEDFDLDPEETEDFKVNIDIPLEVKTGTYDVEVEVSGDDEDGATHSVKWALEIEIEKEAHDIYLQYASLSEKAVSCGKNTNLKISVLNLGYREEDEVRITAKNPELNLDFERSNILLSEDPYDDDSEYSTTIPIVVPSSIKPGSYPIEISVFIKDAVPMVSKTVYLTVDECSTYEEQTADKPEKKQPEEQEQQAQDTKQQPEDSDNKEITVPILKQQNKTVIKEDSSSPAEIILLSSMLTTMIIIIAAITVVFVLNRRRG